MSGNYEDITSVIKKDISDVSGSSYFIDIDGNLFDFVVRLQGVNLDDIKLIYTSLSVIELVIQHQTEVLDYDEYFTEYCSYYGSDYCQYIMGLFDIFNGIEIGENKFGILIHMLWWLTFIINTGWFYADLENNLEQDETNVLYQQLANIESIINKNNSVLLTTFLEGVSSRDFNKWLEIWAQTILELKGQISDENLYLEILESHYSNLFQFSHHKLYDDGDFQALPEENVLEVYNYSGEYFMEIFNMISGQDKGKGFDVQQPAVIHQPRRPFFTQQGQRFTNTNNVSNEYQDMEDNSDDTEDNSQHLNYYGRGGKNSKKEKAIKQNKKKYSIKKKHKNAIKRNKGRYSVKKKHNKTKKRNRHKQKRKNTKKNTK